MAEPENKMNEQTAADPEETVTETTEETVEETAAEETAAEAETAEESAGEESSSETPENKAPASVKEKALIEKVTALEDKVKRQMAEFDNFRKRTTKEKDQMFSMGEKNVIEKMLPVVDNFERGLAAIPEEEKGGALASGMEMIYKQLYKQLEDLGVKPIEAVGKEFDPNFHNAVMQVASEEYESGYVAQEFLKGYTYHDTVIRHSMVGVVQ
jgi:molecular chaperone GrpE